MRILQVSSARNLGGGETHVLELTEHLRKRGHDVVIAGRRSGPLKPDIHLPFLNSADFLTALRLRRILKKQRFEIVHAHVARDYTVVAAAAWGVKNLGVVFTRHLLYPVRPHVLYKRVDGWIAITSQVLATLTPLAPKMAYIIPNWVDLETFPYRPHPLHDPIAVGVLGQVAPHKGHDDAVEAIRLLGKGYRLVVAGKGEAAYIEALRKKSAGLAVDFPGFVSLPVFFEMVDILAAPSWEEPFGIVLLEAMATGIPVVSTDKGGPAEIISSGVHGILAPPRNPAALAEAIRSIANDHALRSRIVDDARKQVEQKYEISNVIPHVEAFYRRVMMRS
jgi:glycosyltransferase involved in cell wall biosynthesis